MQKYLGCSGAAEASLNGETQVGCADGNATKGLEQPNLQWGKR